MSLLIQGGSVITGEGRHAVDVLCEDGLIAAVGPALTAPPGAEVLDASGMLVLPGGVDPHVHLSLPVMGTVSADDFATGTRAAVAGGTTTIVDFVHPARGQDWVEALRDRKREAAAAVCDYALHVAVTWWGDGAAEMMERCVREEGVTTFKLYLAYKETVGLEDDDLRRALECGARLGALFLVHAEEGDAIEELRNRMVAEGKTEPRYHALSRPPASEGDAVRRIAELARQTGARLYIVHVTCREALAALREAAGRGQDIHGETCPHYLLLDDSVFDAPWPESAKFVLSPPLRPAGHQEALWSALADGTLEVVATDHCPFHLGQREAGRDDFRRIPGGAAGLQHRLALLYTYGVRARRLTPEQWVDRTATAPARLMGLYPRKGSIERGADADLVVWDPEAVATTSAATHLHAVDNSIYEGMETHGGPETVIVGGRIAWSRGRFPAEPGPGRYLARSPGRYG